MARALFAGGCFWCLDATFRDIRGVTDVVSGYAGGERPNPSYDSVCSGRTGYAETVMVEFDPSAVSYGDLVTVFFEIHDPTTLNRQGHDVGTQYRSAIFYENEEQHATIKRVISALNDEHIFDGPIVTEVTPLTNFYPAEEAHQRYYEKHPDQAYCQVVISPKIAKMRRQFSHLLKPKS
jgi:peptide-methionine (S)-S-oxide reductase